MPNPEKENVMNPAEKIIVALDTSRLEDAEKLLNELKGLVTFFKIGFELFTSYGWSAVDLVRRYGGRVFLDLKLHDIPNTVSKTLNVICERGVDMVTIHALGGFNMMKRAQEVSDAFTGKGQKTPRIVAVTILTSHTEGDLTRELGIRKSLGQEVGLLADLAKEAGLAGVVSSPMETRMLREKFPENFLLVTPGIRPPGTHAGDQKRIFSPIEAVDAGADYLVVGRPITAAVNPAREAEAIIQSLTPKNLK